MKATAGALAVTLALVVLYAATGHPLALVAMVTAAAVLAKVGFAPDRDQLAPIPNPYRREVRP